MAVTAETVEMAEMVELVVLVELVLTGHRVLMAIVSMDHTYLVVHLQHQRDQHDQHDPSMFLKV